VGKGALRAVPTVISQILKWWARFRFAHPTVLSQNFSTHGRNSISQVQALRGCCNTLQ
jgi:hypothetical protein